MTPDLDPDRRLALAYAPSAARSALEALWRLDVTFAAILATGRDRQVGAIRLAWWREALERLDREPAPAEPLLRSIQACLLPAGIAGAALAAMETGWAVLLSDAPLDAEALGRYAAARGGLLFGLSARLLGLDAGNVAPAGERWALVDLARHSGNPAERRAAFEAAAAPGPPWRWPGPLRPLGMLDALARRDVARGPDSLEIQGAPARMARMLRHRLTGN